MKLVNSLLLLALVIPFFAIANPIIKETSARPCSKQILVQIRNSVEYPEFADLEQVEGEVVVQFNILGNSTVEVTDIQSNDERLKNYVYSKVNGMHILGAACDIKEMTMKFKFILE